MKACKSQCAACPFRSTSLPGYLGNYQGPGHVHHSLWHKDPFFCHTRADYERPDWREELMANGKLCLGSLVFVGRTDYFPKPDDPAQRAAIDIAMRMYRSKPTKFDVMGPREFMDYHTTRARR